MKKLIIVTGHPGSGKTSIAKQLSELHRHLYVSKDALKEAIFDTLGSKDKEWSLKVSAAAHRIMDEIISTQLSTGGSIIVESNFKPELDSQRFTKIAEKYNAECVQILCVASPEVLYERWVNRIQTAKRHEGHTEAISLEEIKENFKEEFQPLQLPGDLIRVNTTDFSSVQATLGQIK